MEERGKKVEGKAFDKSCIIKGCCRRAEKSCKVLKMMMKAAKLGWAGPGAGQGQGWSKARAGLKHELSKAEQGRKRGAGQELGRS